MAQNLPHLIHTIGDPSGIGNEITLKFLDTHYKHQPFRLTVIGSMHHLHAMSERIGIPLPHPTEFPLLHFIDIKDSLPSTIDSTTFNGHVAYQSLVQAILLIKHESQCQTLVTGPINKANLHQAGYAYGGHTEILESLANEHFPKNDGTSWQSDMLFIYKQFRILLLTRHIPLSQVAQVLDIPTATQSILALTQYLTEQGLTNPHYCLFGVNPHAGEIGGTEERDILQPIIDQVQHQSMAKITGPVAADGAFRGFNPTNPAYDAYIAPYHDQGLIPMKLVGGYNAVNVTIGLPFARTSVSHGTANDIVGLNIAEANSLKAAFDMALSKQTNEQTTHQPKPQRQTAHLKHP